jgi:hypothetical protein
MLFSTFIIWLCAISWIRHHESLANAVIGTGAAVSVNHAEQKFASKEMSVQMPKAPVDDSVAEPPLSPAVIAAPAPVLPQLRRPAVDVSSWQTRIGPSHRLSQASAPELLPSAQRRDRPLASLPSLRSPLAAAPVISSPAYAGMAQSPQFQAQASFAPAPSARAGSGVPAALPSPVIAVPVKSLTGAKLKMIVDR